MKKLIVLLCLTVFMVSCASNSGTKNKMANAEVSDHSKVVLADKDSKEKVICKQIKKTGSHRVTTVCQSQSEMSATRKATQRDIQRTQFNSGAAGGAAAGDR